MAFFAQVPAKVNIGSQIGQTLGQGLQSGMGQAMQTQYQRGLLQKALGDVKSQFAQGGKPLDLMFGLMQAGAGIPGSEKYLATLLPALLGSTQAQAIFGGEGQEPGMTPEQRAAQSLGADVETGQPITSAVTPIPGEKGIGLTPGGQPKEAGFLPPIQTPAQMTAFANKYAITQMDPSKFKEGYGIALAQNEQALAARQRLTEEAMQTGKVDPKDAPIYRQIAQKYANLRNPDEITTSATRDYSIYKNAANKLDNAIYPGLARGIAEKATSLTSMMMGKESGVRDKALQKIHPAVRDLVNMGFEDVARRKLAEAHLSPTEIEEAIFPFSQEQLNKIKSFPQAEKMPAPVRKEKLSNFFVNNVTPETSLLALRQRLWDDKGYDWQEIGPAIRDAMSKGLQLTRQQQAEIATLESNPPLQSLSSIFSDWGKWVNYLRGEK